MGLDRLGVSACGVLGCMVMFSAPAVAQQTEITVEAAAATAISDRLPVDTGSAFPADVGRVWLWTKVSGAGGTTITHVWSHPSLPGYDIEVITRSAPERIADYQVFLRPELRRYLADQGIHRIGYRPLRDLIRAGS